MIPKGRLTMIMAQAYREGYLDGSLCGRDKPILDQVKERLEIGWLESFGLKYSKDLEQLLSEYE